MSSQDQENQVDAAISKRLSKLAALPVDTTSLDRALKEQLPSPPAKQRNWHRRWLMLASTAAVLALVTILTLSLVQGREVQASAETMAQMHDDIVSGRVPTMCADLIDEANRAIAAMAGNFPTVPQVPAEHTMSCCMRNVGNKKVACVLLNHGNTPVTMVVAAASDMQSPNCAKIERDGVTYRVQTVNKLSMVMTEREGRWICLISELPQEKLIDLASGIKF